MLSESQKYEKVWENDAYREWAPGQDFARKFLSVAKPFPDSTIVDYGAGTGRGAANIRNLSGCTVTMLDFAPNCLDQKVKDMLGEGFRFVQHDLTKPFDEKSDFGYCTDVMEHIPPKDVDKVLKNITTASNRVFFGINTIQDYYGLIVGEPLHLTVESPFWWHDKLKEIGFRIDWSQYNDDCAFFYGSVYASSADFIEMSALNVDEEIVKENIRKNLLLGLTEVVPHAKQDTKIYLLAGGPSLADFEEKILEDARNGVPCVTVNGTYNWLLERKIKPAAQVMVDARKFNKRFVEPIVDGCKYLMNSQCDNEILKDMPKEQTLLWHSADSHIVEKVINEFKHEWYPVAGGTTVITRAIVLLALLGFRNVEIFGFDSCLREGKHHAYAQPENDMESKVSITLNKKTFVCHPWMVIQAHDFQKVVQRVLSYVDDFNMVVHGDGLIAHILNTAADMAERNENGSICLENLL